MLLVEDPPIAAEMKARRREKLALDALDDLVVHLGGLRDERKAVLAVTEGWLRVRPNPALARLLKSDRGPLIPRSARPSSIAAPGADPTNRAGDVPDKVREPTAWHWPTWTTATACARSAERANRVNVTFYPVGAQGLAVFDSTTIGPEPPAAPLERTGCRQPAEPPERPAAAGRR